MSRIITLALLVLISSIACESKRRPSQAKEHMTAADALTRHYAQSRLSRWKVHGHAAGKDCGVLFVETAIIMDDAMVEALHYGAGAYAAYKGRGVLHFSREHAFRGVAYRDSSRRVWTFDGVDASEAGMLAFCR